MAHGDTGLSSGNQSLWFVEKEDCKLLTKIVRFFAIVVVVCKNRNGSLGGCL